MKALQKITLFLITIILSTIFIKYVFSIRKMYSEKKLADLNRFAYANIKEFENLIASDSFKIYKELSSQINPKSEIYKIYFSDSSEIKTNNTIFIFLCTQILKNCYVISQNDNYQEDFIKIILPQINDDTIKIKFIIENDSLKIMELRPLNIFTDNFEDIFLNKKIYIKLKNELKTK